MRHDACALNAGVVVGAVEAPVGCDGAVNERLHLSGLRDVDGDEHGLAARSLAVLDHVNGLFPALWVEVGHDGLGAGGGESEGAGLPYPRTGASDKGDPPG